MKLAWEAYPHSRKALLASILVAAAFLNGMTALHAARADEAGDSLLRRAIEAPTLSSLSVSPDGRFAALRQERALIAQNRVEAEWVLCKLQSKDCRVVSKAGEVEFSLAGAMRAEMVVWRSDSGAFFFRRRDGQGPAGVWRYDLAEDQAVPWLATAGDVRSMVAMGDKVLIEEGPSLDAIASADRALREDGVRIQSGVTARADLMAGGLVDGRWRPVVQTQFGPRDFRWIAPGESQQRYAVSLIDGRRSAAASPAPDTATTASSKLWGDATIEEAPASDAPSERPRRLVVRRGDALLPCLAEACQGDKLVVDGWRRGAVIFRNVDATDAVRLYAWTPGAKQPRMLRDAASHLFSGGRLIESGGCAVIDSGVICLAEDPLASARLELLGESVKPQILYSPPGAVDGDPNIRVRRIVWPSVGGRAAGGILLTPADAKGRLPLVITSYRCRNFMDGAFHRVPELAGARNKVAVLCAAAGPAPEGDKRPAPAHQAFLEDMKAGAAYLVAQGVAQPDKIAISGVSFSSESVLIGLTQGGGFAAAVAGGPTYLDAPFAPGYDLLGNPYARWATELRNLPPHDKDFGSWKALAPSQHAAALSAPLLMNAPESEFRTALALFYGATNAGRAFELFAYPDEAHLFIEPAHRFTSAVRAWDWLLFWLNGTVDPNPSKAAQYDRWRGMQAS